MFHDLGPHLLPEGATGTVTWSSSDEAVGHRGRPGHGHRPWPLAPPPSPPTLENGQSAQCTVNCTWDPEAAADGEEAPAEQTTVGLSANDITLDSAGDSQQLTVNGAEGEVTWASEDTAVATVDDQGNVTAVAPGPHPPSPPPWGTRPSTAPCAASGKRRTPMRETIETLKTRRSCRAYQPRQVEEGLLQQVLEAGLYAPSGRGAQPVVFVVVQDQATLAELSRLNAAVMGADTDPLLRRPHRDRGPGRPQPPHLGGGWQPGHGQPDERRPRPGPGVLLDPPGPGGL